MSSVSFLPPTYLGAQERGANLSLKNTTRVNLGEELPGAMIRAPQATEVPTCVSTVPLTGDEAHFWLNGYVNKQNCRIWSEANPQVYVETPLHPEKLTVWCALWAGGILLQKR
ncbi:hypothetical protein TNCV_4183031 [Trichonephila clavipes]|nr:hypothetical protein TNCV_4183031 [Trichonephila clavipes]